MKLIANSCVSLFFCFLFLNTFANSSRKKNAFEYQTMQRVRIDFESPNGYIRPLLLGFTTDNAATDGVDYGYDGSNFDQFPDDLFWVIENNNYVIQGVGEFIDTKQYPLAMFLENSGTIKISLNSLENFNETINVFVYDSLLESYTRINETDFNLDMISGDHINRFYIAFKDLNSENNNQNTLLSLDEITHNKTSIQFLGNSKKVSINLSNLDTTIKIVEFYNTSGQLVNRYPYNDNTRKVSISINSLNHKHLIVKVITQSSSKSKLLTIY